MLVGKLFVPKWKHRNKDVRKKALLGLDPVKKESQQIYLEITQTDLELELCKLALKRMVSIPVLIELGKERQDTLGTEINSRLGQLITKGSIAKGDITEGVIESVSGYLQSCNDTNLLKLVLAQSDLESLRQVALLSLDKNAQYADTAMTDDSAALRVFAVQQINKLSTLERVLKHCKTRDKVVYKLAKEKIAAEKQTGDNPKQLQQSLQSLLVELSSIITACEETNVWALQQAQMNVLQADLLRLQQEFSAVSLPWDENLQAQFSALIDRYQKGLEQEQAESKARQIDAEENEAFLDIIQEYCEALQASTVALDDVSSREKWQQLTKSADSTWQLWQQIQKDEPAVTVSPVMQDTIEKFTNLWKTYQAKVKSVDTILRQCEQQQLIIADMQSLLKSEKPLQSKTVEKYTKKADTFFAKSDVENSELAKQARREFKQLLAELQQKITSQGEENVTRLEELATILPDLERALTQGKAKFAVNLTRRWNKINLSLDSSAKQLKKFKTLSEQYNKFLPKVSELREWREWSNVPVKEKLCEDVSALADEVKANENNPSYDHSATMEQLRAYRRDWNKLVDSEIKPDKQLEQKFSAFCEEIHKANQVFFSALADKRQAHYEARLRYCADLETYYEKLHETAVADIDSKHLDKVIRVSVKEWHSLGAVDKAKKEGVYKQFNTVLSKLSKIRNEIRNDNADAKNKLISRAKKCLAEAESNPKNLSSSIETIKHLQSQWKTVGYAAKDGDVWKEFQDCCNKVFECRKAQGQQQAAERDMQRKELETVCSDIETLSKQKFDDTSVLQKQFSTLKQQWNDLSEDTALKGLERRYKAACQAFELAQQKHQEQHKVANRQALRKLWDLCIEMETLLAKSLLGELTIQELAIELQRLNEARESISVQKNSYARQLQSRIDRVVLCLSQLVSDIGQNESTIRSNVSQHESASVTARKRMCLQAEIIADIESPPDERPARMEYQVSMLAKRMTQGGPATAAGEDELLQLVNDWHREQVIVDPIRIDLENRFTHAINKIDNNPI